MNNIINDIGNFIFVEHEPQKSDMIITVGGSFPQIAEKAAELYKNHFSSYIIAGGGYSVKNGCFMGVRDKVDIYNGNYKTECDFYSDVLSKNGVPKSVIIREDRSGHTRENAEFAAVVISDLNILVKKAIIVCKRFHARRCLMFFQSALPDVEFLVVPADIDRPEYNITRDNWYMTDYGIKRVMGELMRCGNQFDINDIARWKI